MRLILLMAFAFAGVALADTFSQPVPAKSAFIRLEAPSGSPLVFRGALSVRPPFPEYGGISGLVWMGEGRVLAVSDRGYWINFSLLIEENRLKGIRDVRFAPILGENGKSVRLSGTADAEDISRDPKTGFMRVSFEGKHRVATYRRTDKPPVSPRIAHPDWPGLRKNGGIESLAHSADGQLWAIAEDERSGGRADIWVLDGNFWKTKHYLRNSSFKPTGAEFGPDGYLYVTERAFSLIGGFRFRLRRFQWGDGEMPETDEILLDFGAETNIDNIEGVTLWKNSDGRIYLLLASDDNFMPVQRNVLALFEVRG